jgi:hypothetical protein
MKTMHTRIDNIISTCAGAIVCVWQYIMKIDLPTDFGSKAVSGILIAFLGGAAGYIGKEVVRVAWESLKTYFKNRKKKR